MKSRSNLSDTDLCVMCGMCIPLCPTYQLYQTETESPRGRIAMMQSIDQQRIPVDQTALTHIDHCLSCLNCERICPSKVPYGQLIDEFRDQHADLIKKPFSAQQILKQATKPNGLEKLAGMSNKPVIKQLVALSSLLTPVPQRIINQPAEKLHHFYPANIKKRGQVHLFTGCTGKSSDFNTIKDTIYILQKLGFDVHLPEEQLCCGAMHQHNGQQQTAQTLLNSNKSLTKKNTTVLFFSPACGAQLQQLNDSEIVDVRLFLYQQLQQQPLVFKPATDPIALHESCSHRNMLKTDSLNYDLLNLVPNTQIIESTQPALCCGAGGLQSLNYPEQANKLLAKKLNSFNLAAVNFLISDNIGCSLHIKSAISAYNPEITILHPVSFLTHQLT